MLPRELIGAYGRRVSKGSFGLGVAGMLLTQGVGVLQAAFCFTNSPLAAPREEHTATLLQNGCVLAVGGKGATGSVATAEYLDPATGEWVPGGALATARYGHTATLLLNGKVLVFGGVNQVVPIASAEMFDPGTRTWSAATPANSGRLAHTATVLRNGKVLIVGGVLGTGGLSGSAELFDPANNTWTPTGSLLNARQHHTATLLGNGKVIVAGGVNETGALASLEEYDPETGNWAPAGSLGVARYHHTATGLPDGTILFAGGYFLMGTGIALNSVENYDPTTRTVRAVGALGVARQRHTATSLATGGVLVAGGVDVNGNITTATEVYDPGSKVWGLSSGLPNARYGHTATALPDARVLLAGGRGWFGVLAATDTFDGTVATWTATGSRRHRWGNSAASLLPNGKVLVSGGFIYHGMWPQPSKATAETLLYDTGTESWTTVVPMTTPRVSHSSTLLGNGKVLVAGGMAIALYGIYQPLSSAEVYDPAAGGWTPTAPMKSAVGGHSAVLLGTGRVLVVGSTGGQLYDPTLNRWDTAKAHPSGAEGKLVVLPSGQVLLVTSATVEIYDAVSDTWSVGAPRTGATPASAMLMPSGKVLVMASDSVSLYDPALDRWTAAQPRAGGNGFPAALTFRGEALVLGGSATVFSGMVNGWLALGPWSNQGEGIYLPDRRVLFDEASADPTIFGQAYLCAPSQIGNAPWRPVLSAAPVQVRLGDRVVLSGSGFRGPGNGVGSTDYPLVQMRSLESKQLRYLAPDSMTTWGDSRFVSAPLTGMTAGYALLTVIAGGVPSHSVMVNVLRGAGAVKLNNLQQYHDGAAKAAIATTTPVGMAVELLYNGSVQPPTNVGSYAVTARVRDLNYEGTTNGTLVILPGVPVITDQPDDTYCRTGGTVRFEVAATGKSQLHYQWYEGSAGETNFPIAGATAASLTTPALQTNTAFWVRVSNELGQAESLAAKVGVYSAATPVLKAFTVSGFPAVVIDGALNTNYVVEYRDSLADTNWVVLRTFKLTVNPYTVFDTSAPSPPRRFYRAYAY